MFGGDVGFVTDSLNNRESLSIYGQTTYHFSDETRLITGARYTHDEVDSEVRNFFVTTPDIIKTSTEEVTGRIAVEHDIAEDAMVYASWTRGFKPGGSNLTYGDDTDGTPALASPAYADERITAYELGLKAEFLDGRVRTNLAAFLYDYKNMQFQATDPEPFQGGVGNIPESEVKGVELEVLALLAEAWTLDMKVSALDTEITSSFEALDNVPAAASFDQTVRYALRQDVKGNELAKAPNLTADISLRYEIVWDSGTEFSGTVQYTYRGGFSQRIFDNPDVDHVDSYEVVNLVASFDLPGETWGFDLMALNLFDEEGVNSRMTDVFGVAATGEQLIAPRQYMAKVRYQF